MPMRKCELLEGSVYLQALAERQILPRVIFSGFKEENLIHRLITASGDNSYASVSNPKLLELIKTTIEESNRYP